MNLAEINICKKAIAELQVIPKAERLLYLLDKEDKLLWNMWRLDCQEALMALYTKRHQTIIIRTYRRTYERFQLSLSEVQDAFSEFMEKILAGKYKQVALKKNFEAFAIYHTIFLIRTKAKRKTLYPVISFERAAYDEACSTSYLRVEKSMDFSKVIDCIPLISNHLYRSLVYLIIILGYNSKDLIPLFEKPELAYDKRYRALTAFKKVLKKEGLWEEMELGRG